MTPNPIPKSGRLSRLQVVKQASAHGGLESVPAVDGQYRTLKITQIELDPEQPRKSTGDLSELVATIKRHGLIHPIIVRPLGAERYMVISGERRYRAHKLAGLTSIKAIVRTPNEQTRVELQLVENLHRKDLDPFEEAEGYARLKTNHGYTDADIAKIVSKSRSRVTEMLSLTRIPPEIREECLRADIPLSRETLYLIARQPTRELMKNVLENARSGLPREDRRAIARTRSAREGPAAKKPKRAYTSEQQELTLIAQSHNESAPSARRLKRALKEWLQEL